MKFKKAVIINVTEAMLDPEYWSKFDTLVGQKVFLQKDDPRILEEIKDADCLLVLWGVPVDQVLIDAAPNLKYIGALATAFGAIDIDYAKSKNIVVTNVPAYATESVAEFVLAAILEQIRSLVKGREAAKNNDFSGDGITARELKASKFAVIGLGEIGNRVAEIAAGFGANVSYWNRSEKNVSFEKMELNELVKQAEIVSLNLAQTPETEGIVSSEILGLMNNNAIFVNTAPMELVDIKALGAKLQANKGFYFISDHGDEMSEEDKAMLSQNDNCILYPPIAYISSEARINKQEIFINNIKAALDSKPQNQVN